MKNFSRIRIEGMTLVFYACVLKSVCSIQVTVNSVAGLICKDLLLQNVDNSIIYFS